MATFDDCSVFVLLVCVRLVVIWFISKEMSTQNGNPYAQRSAGVEEDPTQLIGLNVRFYLSAASTHFNSPNFS